MKRMKWNFRYIQSYVTLASTKWAYRVELEYVVIQRKKLVFNKSCLSNNKPFLISRNVLLSAQMGERASVVLICIITSLYNEVK